jgi:amino acid adenylation domain-containing protein
MTEGEREYLKANKVNIIELFNKYSIGSNYSLAYASKQQKRLWVIDQIEPGSTQYNLPSVLQIDGQLNDKALGQSLSAIVKRHQVLRTTFHSDDQEQVIQVIGSVAESPLRIVDLSDLVGEQLHRECSRLIDEEASTPFDLASDMMLRALLLKLSPQSHVLVITMHHIAADGWSGGVLKEELSALYEAFLKGVDSPLADPVIQYADYSHWQRGWLQADNLKVQLEYWVGRLQGLPTVHGLPLDRTRPPTPSYRGGIVNQRLSADIRQGLHAVAQSQGATLFMALNAAFACLLSRYSGECDIVIGSPIANRERAELAPLVGFFVNILVLRSDLTGDPSFVELISQSKERLLGAYEHQQLPFEVLVDELQPPRSLSHNPLFQVMLILHNNEQRELVLPDLKISQMPQPSIIANYDLTLEITEKGSAGLGLEWKYATDLFDSATIERMAGHFEVMLNGIIAHPQASVGRLPLLSEEEQHRLLVKCNDTASDYPVNRCVHELFEAQVEQTPSAVALEFQGTQWTYSKLNEQANRLARYLLSGRGVTAETLVGICMERSIEMVVAMLGTLKSGGAYVPLDPGYPQARLAHMLEDAGVATVITRTSILESIPVDRRKAVCLDEVDIQNRLSEQSAANISSKERELTTRNLAYVIYTSGSTGKPKGVMIEHTSLVNFLDSMANEPGLNSRDTLLAVTPISFDIHGLELFLPLINGAKVVIASQVDVTDARRLMRLLEKQKVSIMQATPATWKMLVEAYWLPGHAIKLLCGGEAWGSVLGQKLLASGDVSLWNMYGPTETTIWSSVKRIEVGDEEVTIGPPIANTRFYVLDKNLELCPTGVPGELYIGGAGLARGYLNRKELTQEKFMSDPFVADPDARMYRTGDLVRWTTDGGLQFLGRIDYQVKVRGFRIELGEIESLLMSHTLVRDAVVEGRDGKDGEKQLVCYVVPEMAQIAPNGESLRAWLNESLPGYMVPSLFVFLEYFPLTPNGKVDRKALPAPEVSAVAGQYVAPATDTERRLCDIWRNLLGVDQVGVNDSFFKLGGHSLLAMRLVSEIQYEWSINLMIKVIFEFSEVASLAKVIDQAVLEQREGMANKVNRIARRKDMAETLEQEAYDL